MNDHNANFETVNAFDAHPHVVAALADIAPDVDATELDADLHDDLGLDSMDLLNLAGAIALRTGIEIPDRDYPELRTIRRLEAYLDQHAQGATS
jgi:acyl carrier protein